MKYETLTLDQHHRRYMVPLLTAMGFEYQGNGHYFNILVQKSFDFSCYSLEGCIIKVYQEGIARGKQEQVGDVKKALGLTTN